MTLHKKTKLFLVSIPLTIIAITITTICSANANDFQCSKTKGASYPPFANQRQIDFSLKHLSELNINSIRISTAWKNREPKKGKFYWKPFDTRIKAINDNGISLLLTINNAPPTWLCNTNAEDRTCIYKYKHEFTIFVTKLLQRYSGKIDKIQFANEWDNRDIQHPKKFVEFNNLVYNLVKKLSPSTKVVLGGITRLYPISMALCEHDINNHHELILTNMKLNKKYSYEKVNAKLNKLACLYQDKTESFLYVIQNAKYDFIDIHLYDDPENWPYYISVIQKITDKPIIVSELGGPHPEYEYYSGEYQKNRLAKYLQTIESLPITEAYYFKLVDDKHTFHSKSGLIDDNLNKKPSFEVLQQCRTQTE